MRWHFQSVSIEPDHKILAIRQSKLLGDGSSAIFGSDSQSTPRRFPSRDRSSPQRKGLCYVVQVNLESNLPSSKSETTE